MSAAQIRFFTLWRREVNRFMKIKKQTLGAPLLETFLYISVFGAALGSRIDELHGIDYVVFVIPGLIMMAWSINAFSNNSSSILQQKFQGAIQDQLSSPASPLELLLAFSLGGFMRGLIVAVLTFIAASLLVDLPVDHILVLIPALFLVGFFFSQLGVLIGVRAEQFDDVAFAQTFVLQPLIFLGGVFYSAALLPQPFETLTHFNPIYYMINLVRYGFVGYTEVSIPLSLLALTAATAALFVVNLRLFSTRLQAARVSRRAVTLRRRRRSAADSARVGDRLVVLGEDEDRALAGDVGLLAVLDDVHAQRLLALGRAQRHHSADQAQQHVGGDEGVGRGGERGERLVAELGGVAVEEAVGDAVPGDLGEEADEEDPDEAGGAVGGEHVERLVDPGARAPDDDRVAGQRRQGAEQHRPAGADEAAGRGDRDAADDDRGRGADRGHLAAADQVEREPDDQGAGRGRAACW